MTQPATNTDGWGTGIEARHGDAQATEFHRAYGLWIFGWQRGSVFGKRTTIAPRSFRFYGLSHYISGTGWYWNSSGTRQPVLAGHAIVSSPGFVQDYGAQSETCTEDALCFCGPLADRLFNSGVITDGVVTIGTTRRLLSIIELANDPKQDAQLKANMALQNLLTDLYFGNKEEGATEPRHQGMNQLIGLIKEDTARWWTTREMADHCHLSENQFRRVFNQFTGMSPKRYVDQLRMNAAAEMLCAAAITIAETAEAFGYSDPYHFSRRFKEIMGLAPDRYRRAYSLTGMGSGKV